VDIGYSLATPSDLRAAARLSEDQPFYELCRAHPQGQVCGEYSQFEVEVWIEPLRIRARDFSISGRVAVISVKIQSNKKQNKETRK
jgi:hypothetical protein